MLLTGAILEYPLVITSYSIHYTKLYDYIEDSATATAQTIQAGGSLTLSAKDEAGIYSNSKLVSSSITTSDGGANVLNDIIGYLDDYRYATDDGTVTRLAFGDKVRLTGDYANGGKAGHVYEYMGTDIASGPGINLGTQDYDNFGLWKEVLETQLVPEGNSFSPSDSVGVGGIVVLNDVDGTAAAYIQDTEVTAGSNVSLTALENATIQATVDSTVESLGRITSYNVCYTKLLR